MSSVLQRLALLALTAGCRTYDVVYTDDAGGCLMPPNVFCMAVDAGVQVSTCTDITSDRSNCGGCGIQCSSSQFCSPTATSPPSGVCTACPTMSPSACGNEGAAFCTDLTSDNNDCGFCFNKCPQGTQCKGSMCICTLTSCPSDGGVECVDTQTDVNHCGGCNTACPSPPPNETALCTGGQCSQQCVSPFADCDGDPSNGCETDLQTSSSHCGRCSRSCNGETCTGGFCPITSYATGTTFADLAIDSTYVYWADGTIGISKAPIVGGTTTPVSATTSVIILTVDATRLVWMTSDDIESMLLTGGTPTVLVTFTTEGSTMTLHGGYAYYGTEDNNLFRVPEDGSAMPTLMGLASNTPTWNVVDSVNMYFADSTDVSFIPVSAVNGASTLFVTANGAYAVTLDAVNVYWTNSTLGTVNVQAKGTTTAKQIAIGQTTPQPLVTDGTSVYWGNADGTIHRVAVDGTNPLLLATGQGDIIDMAVDGTNVYWVSSTVVAATIK